MVIVTTHVISSLWFYRKNPERFLKVDPKSVVSCGKPVGENNHHGIDREKNEEQELTLSLLKCSDETSLGTAVSQGLASCIPEIYGGALFYVEEGTGEVFLTDNASAHVCTPTPDCIRQAYDSRQNVYCSVSSVPQCVVNRVVCGDDRTVAQDCTVECRPVVDAQGEEVFAVLVVIGKDFSETTASKLGWIQKQIAACYSHIQRTFQSQRGSEERASQQLIKLCGELYDQDAAQLQLKVIRYLEDQTQAECGFLLLVVPEIQELFCQVVGKKVLQEELRFPGHPSSFSVALESRQPVTLDDIPVENRKSIEELLECPLHSFLCVPVMSRSDNSLIALACLANKRNTNRFTDRDIACIRQCFRYTATVITSTIAFQNERKLKVQTQAMLQVARHLFTNLGEFIICRSGEVENFPFIRSRDYEVNVMGSTFIDALRNNHAIREIRHCKPVSSESDCKAASSFASLPDIIVADDELHEGCVVQNDDVRSFENKKPALGKPKLLTMRACHSDPALDDNQIVDNTKTEQSSSFNDTFVCSDRSKGLERSGLDSSLFDKACTSTPEHDQCMLLPDALSPIRSKSQTPSENSAYASCRSRISLASVHSTVLEYLADDLKCTEQEIETYFDSVDSDELDSASFDYNDRKLAMDKPKLGKMRSCHSDPALVKDPPTPVDSKSELNQAFLIGPSDSTNMAAFNSSRQTFSEHNICSQAVRRDPKTAFKYSENPTIVIEDIDSTSSHKIESNSSIETNVSSKSASVEVVSSDNVGDNVEKQADKVEADLVTTVSDANIADMQCPVTYMGSIQEKDLTKLLREVMQQARNLTNAERCSVFLIDTETDELVAKVFDGITTNEDNEVQEEIRLPSTQGIAGHVATTGELLNIKDAYSHPLFYRGIDDSTGFRTRNILCFPIKDDKGVILGVAQLCNKKNGPCFTQFDEDVATAFGIYCCISISHCLMYKKLQDSQHRKSLANELMIYHMQVCPGDVSSLTTTDIPHPRMFNADFLNFSYAPRSLPEPNSPLAILSMFEDLNFISRWKIRRDTLARFILMVKKGYRNPPYHNWMHAYTVAQYCYQLINNLKLLDSLKEIEVFALFIACLCHDIDHRGTNNSFQSASKSVLAALYSSEGSVLERHHFAQTMCILNTEGCNIFENLNSKDYQAVLDLLRDIILATDLAHHLKILKTLNIMADRGFDKTQTKDHKLLLCLLMTACDLSDQTRPWDNTKRVAALIYKEFFSQGDMEKNLGKRPIEMMDRERAQIPELQIGFLDHVATPVYRVLSKMFEPVQKCVNNVDDNKRHWEKISNLIKLKRGGSCTQMTFDEVLAIEEEDTDINDEDDEVIAVSNGTE